MEIATVKDFHQMKVWQKAHELTLAVYHVTATFPRSSIPAKPRGGMRKERRCRIRRFCSIAMGSASELEYHLLLAEDLKMVKPKDQAELSLCSNRAEANVDRTASEAES